MTTITEDIEKVIDMGESLPPDTIVGGIKSVTVMEGKENEFESLFRELTVKVREHDKECNYYDLYKSEQPRTYLVVVLTHMSYIFDYLHGLHFAA